jgi:cell division protein FtsL
VVKPHAHGTRPAARPRTLRSTSAFQGFVFFAVVVVLVCGLGLGRVWLSVQATQASIDSTKLQRDIKLEQYQGDVLEVQQSALSTPSRVQAIATSTMGMTTPTSVSYLDLSVTPAHHSASAALASVRRDPGVSATVATALQAAASEARVLLVGDVGLSSSR